MLPMKTGGRHRPVPARAGTPALLALLLTWVAVPILAQDEAPASTRLTLPGLDREPLTAADLEHDTTLIVVWASWSPRCRNVGAQIDRLAESWSDRARVASVVFQEPAEKIREVVATTGPRAPVYLDLSGDFSKQHAVTTLPMLLVFRDGELAFRGKLGASPDPVIERVLGGRGVRSPAGGASLSSRDKPFLQRHE